MIVKCIILAQTDIFHEVEVPVGLAAETVFVALGPVHAAVVDVLALVMDEIEIVVLETRGLVATRSMPLQASVMI